MTVKQLTKNTKLIVHQITLLHKKVRILRKTNKILVKRRRIKKIRIRVGDVLIVEDIYSLIKQKEIVRLQLSKRSVKENIVQIRSSSLRRYKKCNKTNYNVRTCQEIEETSEENNDIENN